VELVYQQFGHRRSEVRSLPALVLRAAGAINATMREIVEMQYQFDEAFIVDSTPMSASLGVRATPMAKALKITLESYTREVAEIADVRERSR
jgi:hypothetical protein